jgi:hypothetical protein
VVGILGGKIARSSWSRRSKSPALANSREGETLGDGNVSLVNRVARLASVGAKGDGSQRDGEVGPQERQGVGEVQELLDVKVVEACDPRTVLDHEGVEVLDDGQSWSVDHTSVDNVPEDDSDEAARGGALCSKLQPSGPKSPEPSGLVEKDPPLNVKDAAQGVPARSAMCLDSVSEPPLGEHVGEVVAQQSGVGGIPDDGVAVVDVGRQHWLPRADAR